VVKAPRGFTLIEVMVASVISLVMLSGAIAMMIAGAQIHRRQVEQGQLKRSAAFVLDQLSRELRQAGLGRPSGPREDLLQERFPPAVIDATTTSVSFIADVPRPNSNFNGLSTLADDQVTNMPANGLAVLNELNGSCDVLIGAGPCTTDAASLLFPPNPGNGCDANNAAVTCPWALNRYQPNEFILVVKANGHWVERQLNNPPFASNGLRKSLAYAGVAIPATFFDGVNNGYVSTPDRIYYRLQGTTVERRQCWGTVGTPADLPTLRAACVPGPDGLGWEPLITGSTLTFQYYDAANTPLIVAPAVQVANPDLPRIRRVQIQLHVERAPAPNAALMTYDTVVSVSLRQ